MNLCKQNCPSGMTALCSRASLALCAVKLHEGSLTALETEQSRANFHTCYLRSVRVNTVTCYLLPTTRDMSQLSKQCSPGHGDICHRRHRRCFSDISCHSIVVYRTTVADKEYTINDINCMELLEI